MVVGGVGQRCVVQGVIGDDDVVADVAAAAVEALIVLRCQKDPHQKDGQHDEHGQEDDGLLQQGDAHTEVQGLLAGQPVAAATGWHPNKTKSDLHEVL